MTNQRIRYSKSEGGVIISRRVFLTSEGRQLRVELNETEKTYRIIDAVSGETVTTGGDTINLAVLKIQAKQGLVDLGVSFTEELRNRDGVTPEMKRAVRDSLAANG